MKVKNASGKETLMNKLGEGKHFGEIAMIFECERSATVLSNKYGTLASLTPHNYKIIIT